MQIVRRIQNELHASVPYFETICKAPLKFLLVISKLQISCIEIYLNMDLNV